MSLRDLSTDDLLHSIGLQTRRTTTDYLMPALGIFGVGILVGAGVGLLLAPKPGSELRHQLGSVVRRRRGQLESDEETRDQAAE
jgi:hypothetical protein